MANSPGYGMCFACGPDNPIGLHLEFERSGEGAVECRFTPGAVHQGWNGIMHGGLAATLLDEAMAHAVLGLGIRAATARLDVRWRKPVPVGAELVVTGMVSGMRKLAVEAESRLCLADGSVAVEAKGVFMRYGDDGGAGVDERDDYGQSCGDVDGEKERQE